MAKKGLVFVLIGFAPLSWVRDRAIELPPGVQAPNDPVQGRVWSADSFRRDGYTITPVATFEIEARVLGREDYRMDREADLSQVDLALGWGPMSASEILDEIDISQGGRFYRWRTANLPIPARQISQHSANMHLIAGDAAVDATLDRIREGHIVSLSGYLVNVEGDDGWRWRSSLRRTATGAGACERIYVEFASFR